MELCLPSLLVIGGLSLYIHLVVFAALKITIERKVKVLVA